METILREYFALLIEKIRSDSFNISKFKRLETPEQVIKYVQDHLKLLGKGTSRHVFVLNSRQVIKVAIGEKGLAQNEAEVDAFTNPRSKPIIAKIFEADDDFKWLVSELVKPLKSDDEFESLAGMSSATMKNVIVKSRSNDDVTAAARPGVNPRRSASKINQKLIDAVSSFATENKMLWGDVLKLDSWGKTAAGRLVLFDYGATEEIYKQYYVNDSNGKNKQDKGTPARSGGSSFPRLDTTNR